MDLLISATPTVPLLPPAPASRNDGQRIVRAVSNALRVLHAALSDEYKSVWNSGVTVKNADGTTRNLTPQEVFDGLTVGGQPAAALLLQAHALLAPQAETVRAFLAPSLAPIPTAIPAGYAITARPDGGVTVESTPVA